MNILSVILARGGSKGLPGKNIKKIGNLSLVERAIRTSSQCKSIAHTVVSTDSEEIIKISNQMGNFAPFKRPDELARDDSSSLDPLLHALSWSEKNWNKIFDHIVLLEPTCPFRLPEHVDKALKIHLDNKATSTVSLVKIGDGHPIRMKRLNESKVTPYQQNEPDKGLRRQSQDDLFIRNGAVYVFSRETLLAKKLWGNRQHGFIMDSNIYGINIDSEIDLLTARAYYKLCKERDNLNLIE